MKKILLLFISIIFISHSKAQAPQGINYQGVLRDVNGNAISNQTITVEFKIWQGDPNSGGSIIYTEFHTSAKTDTFGLYSLVIGSTTSSGIGSFPSIPWSTGNKWVEVLIDPAGGSSLQSIATQQLMSVPYALYAETSGGGGNGSISGTINNIPRIDNNGNGLGRSLISQSTDSTAIGINNPTPNADAVLDIVNTGASGAAGKGLLIPRMSYNERNLIPVTSANHGLLVYQANNFNLANPQGFWYCDAIAGGWLLLAPAQAVWTLGGNATGTSSFIGSLDDNDIVFKTGFVSATERMRVLSSTNGGNVQFGNSTLGTHYVFPAAKGNAGDVLQLDPSGSTNNLLWKPMSGGGSSPWAHVGGLIYPANLNDTVGIGTSSPQSSLDILSSNSKGGLNVSYSGIVPAVSIVSTNTAAANQPALDVIANTSTGYAIRANNQSGAVILANGGGPYVINGNLSAGGGDAMQGVLVNGSSGNAVAGYVEDVSQGHAGYFLNNSTTNADTILDVINYGPGFSGSFKGGAGLVTDSISITNNAHVGWVLASVNTSGNATWRDPVTLFSGGPWAVSGNNVFTSNGANNVGIGNNSPFAKLDVTSNAVSSDVIAAKLTGSGTGSAINAVNLAGGNAGNFQINSLGSSASVLVAGTNGTGSAANFQITGNTNNAADALVVSTVGTGSAANFSVNNSTSTGKVLFVTTNGSGEGVTISTVSGSAVNATNAGGGNTINSINAGQGGNAGFFKNNNSTNANAVLIANTTGTGPGISVSIPAGSSANSGIFNGGFGLKTDNITITNTSGTVATVLTATNTTGGAAWVPVAGSVNFSVPMNTSGTQTITASNTFATGQIVFSSTPNYVNGGVTLSGNTFTAPSGGLYHFDVQITVSNSGSLSGGNVILTLFDPTGNSPVRQAQSNVPPSGPYFQPLVISVDLFLPAGQKLDLRLTNNATGTSYIINNSPALSWFNGHKIF